MPTNFQSVPGTRTGPSITPRNIFVSTQANQINYAPSFLFLDGTLGRDAGQLASSNPTSLIRPGNILGKITATGKYRPSVLGLTAGTCSGTTLTVTAAVASEVSRLLAATAANVTLTLAGPTSTGATQTVNTETAVVSTVTGTTLTMAGTLTHSYVTRSIVMPADGSQTGLVVFADNVFGTDVTDINGNSIDQTLNMWLRGADLLASMIPNLVTDDYSNTTEPACQVYLKSFLKAGGSNNTSGVVYTFDNDR